VRLEKEVDEQALDGSPVMADPVVARDPGWRVLEPVQRALAGKRGAALALSPEFVSERRQHRVVAQLIVVEEIFVAERVPNTLCATMVATVCSIWP
jgi:hypothetical protein